MSMNVPDTPQSKASPESGPQSGHSLEAAQASSSSAPADRLPGEGPILFYDGHCGLCDHSVTFVLRRDVRRVFRFAQLQGETADRHLPSPDVSLLKSIVLWDAVGTYRQSAAVVRILWWLGGRWRVCSWLVWLVPWPIRDLVYSLISRTRYRFFGRYETCRLPTESERGRLLP